MRLFSASILTSLILLFFSCGTGNNTAEEGKTYTGTIQAAGITSYQYGTHTLETEESFFALKSDSVNLGNYEGQRVTIRATEVEGYPVDGGPIYLNVLKIQD
ncbi:hypothetical protein E0K83_04350 [Gramella sp. BOM4]|nr:hypothetical protein [Christiangramia bathymodioli]